ncbi:hypothetical protein KA005_66680, partial [bacterium]|nr:hypothetical protein [bacterium]
GPTVAKAAKSTISPSDVNTPLPTGRRIIAREDINEIADQNTNACTSGTGAQLKKIVAMSRLVATDTTLIISSLIQYIPFTGMWRFCLA